MKKARVYLKLDKRKIRRLQKNGYPDKGALPGRLR
jgi:hypothetical protein